jgi:hypothetical protein
MIRFASSAGVALSDMYPEVKNSRRWLFHGWHVALAAPAQRGRRSLDL